MESHPLAQTNLTGLDTMIEMDAGTNAGMLCAPL